MERSRVHLPEGKQVSRVRLSGSNPASFPVSWSFFMRAIQQEISCSVMQTICRCFSLTCKGARRWILMEDASFTDVLLAVWLLERLSGKDFSVQSSLEGDVLCTGNGTEPFPNVSQTKPVSIRLMKYFLLYILLINIDFLIISLLKVILHEQPCFKQFPDTKDEFGIKDNGNHQTQCCALWPTTLDLSLASTVATLPCLFHDLTFLGFARFPRAVKLCKKSC